MQDSSSFWTDIKNLEEQLAKSPDSFCFAKLSDVYLKVGLIEDALHVARQGVVKHPAYLSGQKALSLACHAKGLNDEALAALMLVTEAFPEDIQSQKLLGRLYAEAGNKSAACKAFKTALEFMPDDVECQIELESIERQTVTADFALEQDDEDVIEDLEILEEYHSESGLFSQEASLEPESLSGTYHDPLSTGTLAELYVKQGFIHKALEIYRAIMNDNPADHAIAERVAELEILELSPEEPESETVYSVEEGSEYEPASGMPSEAFYYEDRSVAHPESFGLPEFESQQECSGVSEYVSDVSSVPSHGIADNALTVLDGWLQNIGRIKSCR